MFRPLLLFSVLLLLFVSCCPRPLQLERSVHHSDTLREHTHSRDTFLLRDSIYFSEFLRGDTLVRTHYVERWRDRDRLRVDTLVRTVWRDRSESRLERVSPSWGDRLSRFAEALFCLSFAFLLGRYSSRFRLPFLP